MSKFDNHIFSLVKLNIAQYGPVLQLPGANLASRFSPGPYLCARSVSGEPIPMVGMATVALASIRFSNSDSSPCPEGTVLIGCCSSVTPPKVTTLLRACPAVAVAVTGLPEPFSRHALHKGAGLGSLHACRHPHTHTRTHTHQTHTKRRKKEDIKKGKGGKYLFGNKTRVSQL